MAPAAQGPPPARPLLGIAGPALHELGLDADQRGQVRDIIDDALAVELGAALRDLGQARDALERLVWDPAADGAALDDGMRAVSERARALETARHRLATRILDVLTQEQRDAFREMLAEAPAGPPPAGRR